MRWMPRQRRAIVIALASLSFYIAGCNGGNGPPAAPVSEVSLSSTALTSLEFSSSPAPDSENKFVSLPASKTGLYFENYWAPTDAPGLITTAFVSSGTAVGDINNDGLPDLFVTQRDGGGKLFLNQGDLTFTDVTKDWDLDVSDMWGSGATFADVNNDGRLDLYVCGYECDNKLFINLGNRFEDRAESLGLAFNGASLVMTFADYDCDGDLDAYLVTNRLYSTPPPPEEFASPLKEAPNLPNELREVISFAYNPKDDIYVPSPAGQFDHFYRNDNGSFVEVTEESGIGLHPGFGLSATWWDFNNDRWPDLYVANDFDGEDKLYRNNGPDENGKVTFSDISENSLPHTPWYSMGADAADINNDGLLDLMASDMAGTNHYRDKLSMGAMSGPDSTAWFLNVPNPPQYMRNSVYINTGTERFLEVAHMCGLASSDWTWTVRFSDFDQDGHQDCYITNGMSRDWFNGDLAAQAREIAKTVGPMARQDFWHTKPLFKLENLAFRNQGDLKFKNVSADWGLDHLGVNSGAATGDFDLDGDLDLVVCGFNEPLRFYRNDVATGNSIKIKLDGRHSNRQGLGARVVAETADGQTLTRFSASNQGFMSSSEPIHHFGLGTAESLRKLTVYWPSGSVQEFDELPSNHAYVITEPETVSPPVAEVVPEPMFAQHALPESLHHQETVFDDFLRQPLSPNKYSQLGPAIVWGDIDGDGDADCFTGGATGEPGQLSLNQEGTLQLAPQDCFAADSKHEDMGAVLFDADGDSDLDLYVVSGGVECEPGDEVLQDRLYLNDGSGNFARSADSIPDIRTSGGPVSVADFDRDGDMDVFVGGRIVPGQYPTIPESVLLVNEGGTFTNQTQEIAPALTKSGMVTSCLWTDVDQDGWVDLMVAHEWNSVRLLRNRDGKLVDVTSDTQLASVVGWFNSLQGGDIDGDGDTDYVVGNFGLNSKYKATDKKPEVIFYGDFEGKGKMNIVEAKFEGDTFLPRRGLGCTSDAMPMFKEKTETFHDFATSSLVELYTEDKLSEALRHEANRLDTLVLINDSVDGKIQFTVKSLPRSAQVSSVFGTHLVDVDGDGHLDLYAVQNFYGPQAETGYVDGGVSSLMLGDGKGDFHPVRADRSGLVVVGDAKSLSTVDINSDQRPDFMVTINNAHPKLFVNQSTQQSHMIRVDGPSTGASVHLRWKDGRQRKHEIYSTSGYLSQSPPDIFVGTEPPETASVTWPDGKTNEYTLQFQNGLFTIPYESGSRAP